MSHIIPCSQTALHLLFFSKKKVVRKTALLHTKEYFCIAATKNRSGLSWSRFSKACSTEEEWKSTQAADGLRRFWSQDHRHPSNFLRPPSTLTANFVFLVVLQSHCKLFFPACQVTLKEPLEHRWTTETFYLQGSTNTHILVAAPEHK